MEDMGGDGGGERVPSSINVGFDDVEKEIRKQRLCVCIVCNIYGRIDPLHIRTGSHK